MCLHRLKLLRKSWQWHDTPQTRHVSGVMLKVRL